MIQTVDSERLKAVFELTHILRWEEDGGAVFEPVIPLPQAAKTNTPRSMSVTGNDVLYDE
jgi:hypothetical protein